MEQIFVALSVALTSIIAYQIMVRVGVTRRGSVRRAIVALLDYAGTFVLFLAFNLVVGAAIILLIRTFTQRFIALYYLDNLILVILSAAQGFVFQLWWRPDARPPSSTRSF